MGGCCTKSANNEHELGEQEIEALALSVGASNLQQATLPAELPELPQLQTALPGEPSNHITLTTQENIMQTGEQVAVGVQQQRLTAAQLEAFNRGLQGTNENPLACYRREGRLHLANEPHGASVAPVVLKSRHGAETKASQQFNMHLTLLALSTNSEDTDTKVRQWFDDSSHIPSREGHTQEPEDLMAKRHHDYKQRSPVTAQSVLAEAALTLNLFGSFEKTENVNAEATFNATLVCTYQNGNWVGILNEFTGCYTWFIDQGRAASGMELKELFSPASQRTHQTDMNALLNGDRGIEGHWHRLQYGMLSFLHPDRSMTLLSPGLNGQPVKVRFSMQLDLTKTEEATRLQESCKGKTLTDITPNQVIWHFKIQVEQAMLTPDVSLLRSKRQVFFTVSRPSVDAVDLEESPDKVEDDPSERTRSIP